MFQYSKYSSSWFMDKVPLYGFTILDYPLSISSGIFTFIFCQLVRALPINGPTSFNNMGLEFWLGRSVRTLGIVGVDKDNWEIDWGCVSCWQIFWVFWGNIGRLKIIWFIHLSKAISFINDKLFLYFWISLEI